MSTNASPNEIEHHLLSSIRTLEDLLLCARAGITAESFVTLDPNHGEVFAYLERHAKDHAGLLPTEEDLRSLHEFKVGPAGDLAACVDLVHKAELLRSVRSVLWQHVAEIDVDPATAIRGLLEGLGDLQLSTRPRYVYLDRDALQRLEEFDAVQAGKEPTIPTGLTSFDAEGLGFRRGEFVVVIGSTGVGKSWLLMKFMSVAYEAGHKVLLVSPELTAAEQGFRFDTVLAAERNYQFSNMALITGRENRERYERWLEKLTARRDFIVVDASDTGKPLTFEDVWRYAVEHAPDVLAIDGLHLMGTTTPNLNGWEVMKRGAEQLKALAQQLPCLVLAAHQPDRTAAISNSRGIPPGLHQFAYSFAIAQSANRVLSIAANRFEANRLVMSVPKQRTGRPSATRYHLLFDVDRGCIRELSREEAHDHGDDVFANNPDGI